MRGFSSRSESAFPSRSSVFSLNRSRRLLATLLASDILALLVSGSAGRGPATASIAANAEGYGEAMTDRWFLFVQLEFPWELGPPDGRYLMRAGGEADAEHVVVLGTVGARRRAPTRGAMWSAASR